MVRGLPPDSVFVKALIPGGVPWGWDQELAATQVEMLHALIRVLLSGFGAKKHQIPKPMTIDRPYQMQQVPTQPKRKATVKEMVNLLGPMLGGRGG